MKEKYDQNEECKQALLNTGTKRLLELTWDKKWAVGYGLNSKLFHTDIQPGQNLTGGTLQEIRTEFRAALNATGVENQQQARSPTPVQTAPQHTPTVPIQAKQTHERLTRTSPVTEV